MVCLGNGDGEGESEVKELRMPAHIRDVFGVTTGPTFGRLSGTPVRAGEEVKGIIRSKERTKLDTSFFGLARSATSSSGRHLAIPVSNLPSST